MTTKDALESQYRELSRGTDEILVERDLRSKLERSISTKRPLVVKAGFDPTAPDLHLGHTVLLSKMAQFQRFGHRVVFLIGDFTGLVGDPSGKSKTRPQLTREEVAKNAETYKEQVFRVLDPKLTEIRFNSEWLDKLDAYAFVRLAAHANVARMLEREDFKTRYREGQSISVHEFLYPILQAYDSVMLKADVELGGRDQVFNLLLGRELMKDYGQEPQVCMTLPLLEGLDGVQKMSKSLGNAVGVSDAPNEMFGKLMSVPDALLRRYYLLLSARSTAEIDKRYEEISSGKANPRDLKMDFAAEMVHRFHGADAEGSARENFIRVVSQKEAPLEIPEASIPGGEIWWPKVLVELGLLSTTSEGKRLIGQGGFKMDGNVVKDEKAAMPSSGTTVVQYGKRKFIRIKLKA